VFKVLVRTSRR